MASKEYVIYASKVHPRTDAIIRAFVAKNEMTFARAMDVFAYMLVGFDTTKYFDGKKTGEYNPDFSAFDQAVREYMEQYTSAAYRRYPLLRRIFGYLVHPLTLAELDTIEEDLRASGKLEEYDKSLKDQ